MENKNIKIHHDRDTFEAFMKMNEYQEQRTRSFYERMNKLSIEADKEANKEQEQIINKEKGFCVMLPSHDTVIGDKKFPYSTYANLTLNSKFDPVKKDGNYIYKNAINKSIADFIEEAKDEFPNGKLPAPRTIEKHIKVMLKNDIPLLKVENSPNGVVYKLQPKIDNRYYVMIPYQQVRELVLSTNDNMLKLFVILSYKCNTENYTTLDRKYFARKLGLADNSTKNLSSIGTMLNTLRKIGMIDIQQEIRTDWDEEAGREIGKKINSYRLTTLEEYKEANKIKRVKK